MAAAIPDPPTRPHPIAASSVVERRSRGNWLQTAPQEPQEERAVTAIDWRALGRAEPTLVETTTSSSCRG